MNNPFVPNKPEEMIVCKISKREAITLEKLRRYAYGEFTIIKTNGLILDLIIKDRQRIDENTEIDLT